MLGYGSEQVVLQDGQIGINYDKEVANNHLYPLVNNCFPIQPVYLTPNLA